MDQGSRLVLNTICNVTELVIRLVIGFVMTPIILHHLGRSVYGIWALTGSLLAYSSLLSLGLNSAVNRWIPVYLVQKDYDGINRVVNTTLVAYLTASGILALAVFVLACGFPYWFGIPPELHTASRLTVALVGMGFIVLILLNVFLAVLSGLQRYELLATCDIVTELLWIVGIVIVILSGHGLVALAVVSAASRVTRAAAKTLFARRCCRRLIVNLSLARWRTFREMLGYSINTLLFSCGQVIQRQAALILIGALMGVAAVAEYAMPLLLAGLIGQLVITASQAMKPAASRLDAQERLDHVRQLYVRGTKYALLLVVPMAAFVFSYGSAIMRIWLKEEYVGAGATILWILVVGVVFRVWHVPAFFIVVGLGRHRFFGIVTLAMAVFCVILSLILTVGFDMGVVGVAVGFAVPEVLVGAILVAPYCCRSVGLTLRKELKACVLPALIASLPALATLMCAKQFFEPEALTGLLVLVGLLAVSAMAGWWWLGLSPQEKLRFAKMPIARRMFRG